MPIPDTAPITQAAYAAHRKALGLVGASAMAVSRAVRGGRLDKSVARDAVGNVLGIADVDLADREWLANTDYTDAPQLELRSLPAAPVEPDEDEPDGADPREPISEGSLASAAARAKHWDAELKELKYREAAKELIPARDVEQRLVKVFSSCKAQLLTLPSRAKQALPHLTLTDLEEIDRVVREALQELTQVPNVREP